MAFQDTCYSVIIDAVLTDKGREKMARGTFEVVKFAFGDDEIDYSLQPSGSLIAQLHAPITELSMPTIHLTASAMYEAFGNKVSNIHYGLTSFPSQEILYLPVLKLNKSPGANGVVPRGGFSATTPTGSVIYLSVNTETTEKVNSILSGTLPILEASTLDSERIIIESGLDTVPQYPSEEVQSRMEPDILKDEYFTISLAARQHWIARLGLMDYYYSVYADERFVTHIIGPRACDAKFKNYADGKSEINFISSYESIPTTLPSSYENYRGMIIEGVPNEMANFNGRSGPFGQSVQYSSLKGPKGTITAINLDVDNDLKVNSKGERNYKYTIYGETDVMIFDDTHKFDYIDTSLEIIGEASLARMHVPIRLIRYSGK